jgi:hypothetical protein
MLIIRIFAMLKNNKPINIADKLNEFSSRSVNEDLSLCHKMLGDTFRENINNLYQALTRVFGGDDEDFGKYLTYDGFIQILAIIGTNSQGIGSSSFANWVNNVNDVDISDDQRKELDDFIDSLYTKFQDTVGEFLNNEGSGLYEIQSKINHSCLPNAEIKFPKSNHVVEVVALRDIQENEEICISYLDECQLQRSRHSRQKYLLANYLFECDCLKCQSEINQPDETSDEEEDADMDSAYDDDDDDD